MRNKIQKFIKEYGIILMLILTVALIAAFVFLTYKVNKESKRSDEMAVILQGVLAGEFPLYDIKDADGNVVERYKAIPYLINQYQTVIKDIENFKVVPESEPE